MELEPHFDIDNVLGTKSGRIKARLGLIQPGTYGEDDRYHDSEGNSWPGKDSSQTGEYHEAEC